MRIAKILANNVHFAMTVLLLQCIVPALKAAGLPLKFDWAHFFRTFWLGLTIQSAFFACLLYVAGFPFREAVKPVWVRYRQPELRLLILALHLGRKRAFQLVATVVTASYLSLAIYYVWPSP